VERTTEEAVVVTQSSEEIAEQERFMEEIEGKRIV